MNNTHKLSSLLFQCRKLSEVETPWGWMKRIRTFEILRDGTMIKLDVTNGVYTVDLDLLPDERGPVVRETHGFRQACNPVSIV